MYVYLQSVGCVRKTHFLTCTFMIIYYIRHLWDIHSEVYFMYYINIVDKKIQQYNELDLIKNLNGSLINYIYDVFS